MEIRNRETGAVIELREFLAANPNTSFPRDITEDILDSYGYDKILEGVTAKVTPPYGISSRDGIEEIDGDWYTRYVAGPVFTDIEGGQTASEQEAEYRAAVDARVATQVRRERNQKLVDTDWTQLADSTTNATAWGTYRQALRDLPTTDGFPHNVTWPTEPS